MSEPTMSEATCKRRGVQRLEKIDALDKRCEWLMAESEIDWEARELCERRSRLMAELNADEFAARM
jgi:hypothetical protein